MMRTLEFVQSATDGGHPAPNGSGFEHGEPVVLVSKRELAELAVTLLAKPQSKWAKKELKQLAKLGDLFIQPIEVKD